MVIVILGLLVSLVSVNLLPTLSNAYVEVAKQDIAKIDIDKINQGVIMYKLKNNKYPTRTRHTKFG